MLVCFVSNDITRNHVDVALGQHTCIYNYVCTPKYDSIMQPMLFDSAFQLNSGVAIHKGVWPNCIFTNLQVNIIVDNIDFG